MNSPGLARRNKLVRQKHAKNWKARSERASTHHLPAKTHHLPANAQNVPAKSLEQTPKADQQVSQTPANNQKVHSEGTNTRHLPAKTHHLPANVQNVPANAKHLPAKNLEQTSEVDQHVSKYRGSPLYEKYIPDIECYNAILKPRVSLSFPLDFPKPVRPGTKTRSRPSALKRVNVPLAPAHVQVDSKIPTTEPPKPIAPGESDEPSLEPSLEPSQNQALESSEKADPSKSEEKKKFWHKLPCWKKKKAPVSDTKEHAGDHTKVDAAGNITVTPENEEKSHHSSVSPQTTVESPSPPPPPPPKSPPPISPSATKPRKRIEDKKDTTLMVSPSDITPQTSAAPSPSDDGEQSKSPKGILKSSVEKMQPGKSVSIHTPQEINSTKPPPKHSMTHFRSKEISPVTNDSPTSERTSATDETELSSAPTTSLKSQRRTPLFARAFKPPLNVSRKRFGKGKEEGKVSTVAASETPLPESTNSGDQEISPLTSQPPLEKTVPTSPPGMVPPDSAPRSPPRNLPPPPEDQLNTEAASALTTSLRSQKRARMFARASTPSPNVATTHFRSEEMSPTADSSLPHPKPGKTPLKSPTTSPKDTEKHTAVHKSFFTTIPTGSLEEVKAARLPGAKWVQKFL
ncbi:proteoglycan 4-like isoform X1 [Podarcis raffonei]|uniref:proteoglycan 4-like isoform X1 n=1 Tax=Podarcis raffonei TaxID=65483 RepID=UPI002329202D|nr:proteoglycan 4-like isoform X1 [Podarcis raffonei]XP_053230206.1 proteoglycan 4-like isoform X1 [Podarcis raffonei]